MSKKSQGKKHKFKHAESRAVTADSMAVSSGLRSSVAPKSSYVRAPVAVGRDFSYVLGDLQRIVVLAVSFVLVEAILWFLFAHTGFGAAVYHLVQV
jgi:hypothetical protein